MFVNNANIVLQQIDLRLWSYSIVSSCSITCVLSTMSCKNKHTFDDIAYNTVCVCVPLKPTTLTAMKTK